MSARFKISTKVTVRFSDTDAMGHCNNANFFSYMEEGRIAYFKRLYPGDDSSPLPSGERVPKGRERGHHTGKADAFSLFPFILADIQCSFKSPVFFAETIIVSLGVTGIGTKSFTMEYELHEEKTQRLVAIGKSVLVMFDYEKNATYPIPEEFKRRIAEIEGKNF